MAGKCFLLFIVCLQVLEALSQIDEEYDRPIIADLKPKGNLMKNLMKKSTWAFKRFNNVAKDVLASSVSQLKKALQTYTKNLRTLLQPVIEIASHIDLNYELQISSWESEANDLMFNMPIELDIVEEEVMGKFDFVHAEALHLVESDLYADTKANASEVAIEKVKMVDSQVKLIDLEVQNGAQQFIEYSERTMQKFSDLADTPKEIAEQIEQEVSETPAEEMDEKREMLTILARDLKKISEILKNHSQELHSKTESFINSFSVSLKTSASQFQHAIKSIISMLSMQSQKGIKTGLNILNSIGNNLSGKKGTNPDNVESVDD